MTRRVLVLAAFGPLLLSGLTLAAEVQAVAHRVPPETANNESAYFSIVQGLDGKLYIGTSKYGVNAYMVAFDPQTGSMRIVIDAHEQIGTDASGFAAQAKFHTRNFVGRSGRIYAATKQGYPEQGESREDYPGGYSFVYDPQTGQTEVYGIPIPHHGIISIVPDESRNVAYISTCDDRRPIENTHFMILDLQTGEYRELMNAEHSYAFIVVDHKGRAYHPIRGGDIARYDPDTQTLDRLSQTIDGEPPTADSLLANEVSHPINWDITADRRTLYAVAMSGNQLYRYDLATDGQTLAGESLGPLVDWATRTDCRAMCVAPDGVVWAAVRVMEPKGSVRLVRFDPDRDAHPVDLGQIVVTNSDYATMVGPDGKTKRWHHGMRRMDDGRLTPVYPLGIAAGRDGRVYVLTIYPLTVLEIDPVEGEDDM